MYIDPASGSLILQVLAAAGLAAASMSSRFRQKVKSVLHRIRSIGSRARGE